MTKKKLVVTFSGGRTSARMSKWLIDYVSHIFDLYFIFANTGQEHEETLIFVNKCDKAFGLSLVWVEAVVNPKDGKVTTHKIVDYNSACRDGRLFDDVCKKYGLPNKSYPHCTRELKIRPIKSWMKDNNCEGSQRALGIRSDEPSRVKRKSGEAFYPLVDLVAMTKEDVFNWWKTQDFDLNLPEQLGNCTWCFKKSLKKLLTISKEEPGRMSVPLWLETKYSTVKVDPSISKRREIFRENRTTVDLLMMAQGDFKEFKDLNYEDCAEECGSVIPEEIAS